MWAGTFCFTHCYIPSTEEQWVAHIRRWINIYQTNQYIIAVLKKSNRQPLGTISSLILSLFASQHYCPCQKSMRHEQRVWKEADEVMPWRKVARPEGTVGELGWQVDWSEGKGSLSYLWTQRCRGWRRKGELPGRQQELTRGTLLKQSRKAVEAASFLLALAEGLVEMSHQLQMEPAEERESRGKLKN